MCAVLCLLACLLTFWFAFLFYAYLYLRCATHDDVIEAIEKTRNDYPQSNFNRLTNQKGITLPIEKPPSSNTAVYYSETDTKPNKASLDCLLRNATEGDYIKYILQPTGKNM